MKNLKNLTLALMAAATIASCQEYVAVETFAEADDPVALTAEQQAAWTEVSGKLNAAWGCPESQYARSIVPEKTSNQPFHITAWKGERASAQSVL